jgi:hypothetical protein
MDTLNKRSSEVDQVAVLRKIARIQVSDAGVSWQCRCNPRLQGRAGRAYSAASSFLRLINRFTSAQVTNSRCAFFFSPRYRTFTNPNFTFIT